MFYVGSRIRGIYWSYCRNKRHARWILSHHSETNPFLEGLSKFDKKDLLQRLTHEKVSVKGLKFGILDGIEGLKRGIYECLNDSECPICHRNTELRYYQNEILCSQCFEQKYPNQDFYLIGEK